MDLRLGVCSRGGFGDVSVLFSWLESLVFWETSHSDADAWGGISAMIVMRTLKDESGFRLRHVNADYYGWMQSLVS